jgi:hypothetical protein
MRRVCVRSELALDPSAVDASWASTFCVATSIPTASSARTGPGLSNPRNSNVDRANKGRAEREVRRMGGNA